MCYDITLAPVVTPAVHPVITPAVHATLPLTAADALPRMQRRTILSLITGLAIMGSPSPTRALFESPTERSLQTLASSLPRVQGLITEVAEIKRLRVKLPADPEDDAYVLRFARSVLEPLNAVMTETAPSLGTGARDFADDFRSHTSALDVACRSKSAETELEELRALEVALAGFLDLGKRYNVKPRDDINSYSGAAGVLYNKFLFRAG